MRTQPVIAVAADPIRRMRLTICFAALVLASTSAAAGQWPNRPLTMVVPFAAGSGSDTAARIVSARLSEVLGQQVIVENISGAGGMIGAYRVAKASPDGYQLILGTAGTHAISQTLYRRPLYDAVADFAPVAFVAEQPTLLIARADLPASNLMEFIAYAKANQARMQFGSAGAGSVPHLACELLNAAAGIKVTHVPYRGAMAAMQDLIARRIDYQCVTLSPAMAEIESKMVKAIAIFTHERSPSLPELASAREQAQIDLEASTWYAIFAPKGTPASIIAKLSEAVAVTMDTPAVQQRLKQIGVDPASPQQRSTDYLQRFVKSEIVKWAGPIKAAGVDGQ
ncbi:MAG: tripartite tricarboxylate transporter substrate binding protein [Alphaproteobacteria bacterium]|nr:tripartite tricarboxylate transporter substrate binding protein [Alphaproteobacteria bacterium]